MPQYRSLQAWIAIDGLWADEYDVEVAGNTTSCWIASQAGKSFSVCWQNSEREYAIDTTIYIDGVECGRQLMVDRYTGPHKSDILSIDHVKTSDWTRRPFVFSPLAITDDDRYLDTMESAQYLGTIHLDIWRIQLDGMVIDRQVDSGKGYMLPDQIVHEKSKKAGAHHSIFGDEYVVQPHAVDLLSGYKLDPYPIATFIFRYRPIDILMANNIVPRPIPILKPQPIIARTSGSTIAVKREEGYGDARTDEIRNLEDRLRYLHSLESGSGQYSGQQITDIHQRNVSTSSIQTSSSNTLRTATGKRNSKPVKVEIIDLTL